MPIQIPLVETDRDKVQKLIKNAASELYKVAKSAYGPGAGNVMLGFKHGAPLLSRDGVTNMSQVRLTDPFEDDVVQAILQVSQKNNVEVGDGTTAVVILTYHLLRAAQRMEGRGFNPMEIAKKLKTAETVALKHIKSLTEDAPDAMLTDVATIAAGDEAIGNMIADIMREIGIDGGTVIEQYDGLGIHNEVVDGFYFRKGYVDTFLINDQASNQSLHHDVPVLISDKLFNTEVDIAPVLQATINAGFKELILVADVRNAALETLKMSKGKGVIMVVPVEPPFYAGGQTLFMDDMATMLGCEVYNGVAFDPKKHLGMAGEVLVTEWATSILGGDSDKEALQERIDNLHKQLAEETHPQSVQFIKERLARLTGKMAIIKVGGATEFERDEVKERVRDAVCAVQSAMKGGIVPGGGTTLARVTGTDFDDAFRQPFKQLVENVGENPEAYLAKLDNAKVWEGFNLRQPTGKLVDLKKAGVIDASLVAQQTVMNAVSMASGLITASAAVTYQEKE